MNYKDTKELLKQYLFARIPFIAIKTIEKARTINMLKENAPVEFIAQVLPSLSVEKIKELQADLEKQSVTNNYFLGSMSGSNISTGNNAEQELENTQPEEKSWMEKYGIQIVVALIGVAGAIIAAIIGVAVSVICLVIFGSESFLIPSMLVITLALTALRFVRSRKGERENA